MSRSWRAFSSCERSRALRATSMSDSPVCWTIATYPGKLSSLAPRRSGVRSLGSSYRTGQHARRRVGRGARLIILWYASTASKYVPEHRGHCAIANESGQRESRRTRRSALPRPRQVLIKGAQCEIVTEARDPLFARQLPVRTLVLCYNTLSALNLSRTTQVCPHLTLFGAPLNILKTSLPAK